jgi:hypothetical protein
VITSGRVTYQGPARALLDDEARLKTAYLG